MQPEILASARPLGVRSPDRSRDRAWSRIWALGTAWLLLAGLACDSEPGAGPDAARQALPHRGPFSADAKFDTAESLKQDLATPRHASDGGGRAWIADARVLSEDGSFAAVERNEAGEPVFAAGSRGRFRLVYEAGPLGVAAGGAVFLQVSPFWKWDDPQPSWADAPGYTEFSTTAEDVTVEPLYAAPQLLGVEIGGRSLAAGEQIEIVYGAGPAGAQVDTYAETGSRLWIGVDGDGDGVRSLVDASPTVEIRARAPVWGIVTLPTTAAPGDPVRATFAFVDAVGNAAPPLEGDLEIDAADALGLPSRVRLTLADRGRITLTGRAGSEGTYRLTARIVSASGEIESISNPLVVRRGIRRVLWADLHGHSHLSDGTGSPNDFYAYARDVAALDVAALTDHDHWGMRFLDATPAMWAQIREAAARHNEPGRFVTLLGYEWTSWLQGHRHVLYFEDEGEVLSSMDPRYETPPQLWSALEGKDALTFAHHSAGGPVSTNWTWAPPPEIEPVTEIVSVHGASESPDAVAPIYEPVAGNFVRDALRLGYRFGFIGSSDSHDGHPGLAGIAASGVSGLAAIHAEENTREFVLAALRARDTYATNGSRMHLDVTLTEEADESGSVLRFAVAGTAPLERIDFIRTGLTASVPVPDAPLDFAGERRVPRLAPGEYLYLRVEQIDGGTAWSSPFYGPATATKTEPGPSR